MVVHFKTIPPVVLIPKETQCYLCMGQEKEEPGEKKWADHRSITDKTGCASSAHVPCMENFIATRLRADPESELVCACTRPIVKLDGKYVGPLYGQLKDAALYDHLKSALSDNNEPEIQEIFSQLALQENSIKLANIFRKAAQTDDQELLKKLLNSPLATLKNLSIASQYAAAFKHSDFLKILLASDPIKEESRGRAAVEAARNGDTNSLQMLLASGPIKEDSRGEAAVEAARNDDTNSLQMLLASGPIKEDSRGQAAVKAAINGDTNCLQMVLGNGPIPEESRILALFYPIRDNNESCLRLLLPGREELGTVGNGIQDYLRVLLKKKQLSPKEQGACLKGAASQGDLASVTELCQQESILQEDFNVALYYSCQYPECLKVLLQNRLITEEGIERTLRSQYTSLARFSIPLMRGFSQKEQECFHLLVEHRKPLQKERTASIVWTKVACVVGAAAILHGLWVNYTNQVEAD